LRLRAGEDPTDVGSGVAKGLSLPTRRLDGAELHDLAVTHHRHLRLPFPQQEPGPIPGAEVSPGAADDLVGIEPVRQPSHLGGVRLSQS